MKTRSVCGVARPAAGALVDPSECVVGYKSETRVDIEPEPGLGVRWHQGESRSHVKDVPI